MTEPPTDPGIESDAGTEPAYEGPPGVPRWVKASAIIAALVILVLVAAMLIAGGDHGPGRHSAGATGQPEQGVTAADRVVGHGSPELADG